VVERVELKLDGMYQVDILHHRKYVLYFHGKCIKSAADRVTTDPFLVTLQSAFL